MNFQSAPLLKEVLELNEKCVNKPKPQRMRLGCLLHAGQAGGLETVLLSHFVSLYPKPKGEDTTMATQTCWREKLLGIQRVYAQGRIFACTSHCS